MTAPIVSIAMTGDRSGLIIATIPAPDRYHSGARLVVGDVRRISADGEPEAWKAWLWPAAGGVMHVTQSTGAIEAKTAKRLGERLQERAGKQGPWWSVPDGRCPVVLEHAGRQSRCETASAVAHDVHRHRDDGVEWMSEEDFMRPIGGEGVESAV